MPKAVEVQIKGDDRQGELTKSLLSSASSSGKNVFERTVETLGGAIKHGVVLPGDRLPPERELATLMGISRTTVRAAIQILVDGGLLVSRRGRGGGTFVADKTQLRHVPEGPDAPTKSDSELQETHEKRWIIECGVAELAAEKRSKEDIIELRALVGEMAELVENFDAFRVRDMRFHLKIAQVTQNSEILRLTGEIQNELAGLLSYLPPSKEALLLSNQKHAEIVAAIADGDGEKARRVMNDHIGATRHFLKGLLLN